MSGVSHGKREPLRQDPLTLHYLTGLIRRAAKDERMQRAVGPNRWRAFVSSAYALAHDDTRGNELSEFLAHTRDSKETQKLNAAIADRSSASPLARVRSYFGKQSEADEHRFSAAVLNASRPPQVEDLHLDPIRTIAELRQARKNWARLVAISKDLDGAAAWVHSDGCEDTIYFPREEYFVRSTRTHRRTLAHEFAHTQIDLRLGGHFGNEFNEVAAKIASRDITYERDAGLLEAVSVISDMDINSLITRVVEQSSVIDFYVELESRLGPSVLLMLATLKPSNYSPLPVKWPLGSIRDGDEKVLDMLLVDQLRRHGSGQVRISIDRGIERLELFRVRSSHNASHYFMIDVPKVVENAFTRRKEELDGKVVGPLTLSDTRLSGHTPGLEFMAEMAMIDLDNFAKSTKVSAAYGLT